VTSHAFHGYAIISDDDMIADATGKIPDSLKSEADWIYFQAELDLCDLILLGRISHEFAPNPNRKRRRLVVSRAAKGLERRDDAHWWNPSDLTLADVLTELLPAGGRIGVPGGQGVFDLVLNGPGFSGFHLTRANGVMLPGGQPVFGECEKGFSAEDVLSQRNYRPGPTRELEPGVDLVIWTLE
jgi:hypothetical protein